jgi:hypothetical protein
VLLGLLGAVLMLALRRELWLGWMDRFQVVADLDHRSVLQMLTTRRVIETVLYSILR